MELGRFRVNPERRELLVDGAAVSLGSRAFDIARLLVEAEGSVVTKDEIIRQVWNGTIVEENSIQVAVSALRKALGNRRELVRTVSGRGYQLLAEPPSAVAKPGNLPVPISDLIGRASELDDIAGLIGKHRLVTLTGAGGIGKTRLGLEIARRLLPTFSRWRLAGRLRRNDKWRPCGPQSRRGPWARAYLTTSCRLVMSPLPSAPNEC